jgi:YebC/PmpR family DNA-binding regulatory protein
MSGHNKWSQIKHKKAKEDSKKGKAFTKLIKEIAVAAKNGGGDAAHNPHLRLLLEKAKQINMPQENSQRAIKRGTGELPGVSYEHLTYEGYGPFGIAIMVELLSDNKNRTAADMRRMFTNNGGNLGETGSVGWMFERKGVIRAQIPNTNEDALLDLCINDDINIDDIKIDEHTTLICDPKDLFKARVLVENLKGTLEDAALEWVAKGKTELSDEQATKAYEFLEAIDNHEDVQNVFTNLA